MRHGVIISFNKDKNSGIIQDANDQEIDFFLDSKENSFSVNDLVSFSIVMTEIGLVANNLIIVMINFGSNYVLKTKENNTNIDNIDLVK
ncbi:hypothetical protein GCM10008119_35070 [Pedobacter mendelii]|uniref:CSD domain-containing protein n=1 Tax=Pedobacter mendelii TaxID=1908240 RepID=A0ABQ2BNK9_9SPHI|nr:hypothetical protein GCM10008119_35070 [Pedobacter mendelii]